MKVFYTTFFLSIILLVAGFFCPPVGVIDGSVLSAVGLLLAFATLGRLPDAIKAGRSITLQKGDFSISAK